MRKLFLCAAAAIVALASCSKTEVINTEDLKEIGFKAVTGAITKAEQSSGAGFTQDLGVFAYVNYVGTTTDGTKYFENAQFVDGGDGTWIANANNPKYWPVYDNLDFVVYSPYNNVSGGAGFNYPDKKLTVVADNRNVSHNFSADIEEGETDYLYGKIYFNNGGDGFDKRDAAVPVTLNHAMAKISVSFSCTNAKIKNVQLDNAVLNGTYTVDYGTTPIVPVWSNKGEPVSDKSIYVSTNGESSLCASVYVVPETKSTITFTYLIDGSEKDLTYTIPENIIGSNWVHGTHYTYKVTLTPKEIKFTPSVTPWDTGEITVPVL